MVIHSSPWKYTRRFCNALTVQGVLPRPFTIHGFHSVLRIG
ncbi:unnamed protein product [Brassica rapa subsp. narinosa]